MAVGIDVSTLERTIQQYNAAREGKQADPFGKSVFPQAFSMDVRCAWVMIV